MNKKKTLVPTIRSSAAEYLTFVAASGENGVEAVYADKEEDSVIRNFRITSKDGKSYNVLAQLPSIADIEWELQKIEAERLRMQIPSNFRQFKLEAVKYEQ